MLYDKEFLLKLDKVKNKTLYARIITLNFEEYPVIHSLEEFKKSFNNHSC